MLILTKSIIALILGFIIAILSGAIIIFLLSYIAAGVIRRLVFSFYNGESISDVFSVLSNDMISQPVLEFFYDFIPMGQCLQITSNSVFHPFRLPLYSLLFATITVICGILAFGKRDVK